MWYWNVWCGTGAGLLPFPGGSTKGGPCLGLSQSLALITDTFVAWCVFLAFTTATESTNSWKNSPLRFRYMLPGTRQHDKDLASQRANTSGSTGFTQSSWPTGEKAAEQNTTHQSVHQVVSGVSPQHMCHPAKALTSVGAVVRSVKSVLPSPVGALSSIRPWCFFQLVANWCLYVLAAAPALR